MKTSGGENQDEKNIISGDEEMQTPFTRANADANCQYPNLKRMMEALDRFLDKRVAGISGFFFLAILGFSIGIISRGVVTNAVVSGGGGGGGLDIAMVWLYSFLGVFIFVFILVLIRVVSIRAKRRQKRQTSEN